MVEIPENVLTPTENEETLTPQGTEAEQTVELEETTPVVEEPKPPEVDYKKKFGESAREVQRLLEEDKLNKARLAEIEAKLEKSSAVLSEDDLMVKYPDWDLLTEAEKSILRRVEAYEKDIAELKEEKAWQKDFNEARKQFPILADREQEFKEYCYKYPRSVDATTLAKSFLYEEKETPIAPAESQRKGLETPTSGVKEGITPGLTWEDVTRLRETQPRVYEKMIREGKLNTKKIVK